MSKIYCYCKKHKVKYRPTSLCDKCFKSVPCINVELGVKGGIGVEKLRPKES